MRICGICPTFRQPKLLASLVACWEQQDYQGHRHLIILDDAQTFDDNQRGDTWELRSVPTRFPSLVAKYNALLAMVPSDTDAVLVIETDDIYCPPYVRRHAECLATHEYSKPLNVYSEYTGKLAVEGAAGRFHSSIGFRYDLIKRIGGWPNTKLPDFDQQLMATLAREAKSVGDPWSDGVIPYVYRWHSGTAHCQSTMDRGPNDETWYDRAEQAYAKVDFVGQLVPCMDAYTKLIMGYLGYEVALHA
jgi:hypothetical protein